MKKFLLASIMFLLPTLSWADDVVGSRYGACPDNVIMEFTYYGKSPDAEDAIYYVISLNGKELVKIYFDGPEDTAKTVELLTRGKELTTIDKLKSDYPAPCDLIRMVTEKGV